MGWIKNFLLLFLTAAIISGCAFVRQDRIHYTWNDASDAACHNCTPASDDSIFVGLALSGGGARASVYGAAGIEALTDHGLMDEIGYVSSVSGGGFAAAYFALYKPSVAEEFENFQAAMRHNFLTDLTIRQLTHPNRFSSPTRRLSSLQDALDDQFINKTTFGELPPSPVLLINGARYDDARRFVFSNAIIPEDEILVPPFSHQTLRSATFSLPGCPRATPPEFSVALAIAISAGFPPLLGPAAIQMPENCTNEGTHYWHLGDGGILENTGVETLEDYALRSKRPNAAPTQVVIFSLDAGRSTDSEIMMQTRNLKLWTTDPGRVVDIVGKRANAFRTIGLETYYAQSGVNFLVLSMRYTDAKLTQWPASCGPRVGGVDAIAAELETIPTNFKITQCHADLMAMAAKDVVQRAIDENRDALAAAGMQF